MITPAPTRSFFRRPHPLRALFAAACAGVLLAASGALPVSRASAAPEPDTVDATDMTALRAHLNQQVVISGTPSATGHSKTGDVGYLNFGGAHQGVALVFFLKQNEKGKAGTEDELKAYVGKPITVSGKLTEYKGDLQIKVESLDLIKTAP